jgi:hypothetical protein
LARLRHIPPDAGSSSPQVAGLKRLG